MAPETYNLLEEVVQQQLDTVKEFDPGSKEGKDSLAKSVSLVELLIAADKDNAEYIIQEEKLKNEKERNEAMAKIECDKQKLTFDRVGLEMAKVIVPAVISLIGYNIFQKRVLKFEETGRLTSTASRELHFPRIFK